MRSLLLIMLTAALALTLRAAPSFHRPAVEEAIRHFHLNDAQSLAWNDTDSLVKVYYIPRILLMKYAATVERRYLDPFHSSIAKGITMAEGLPEENAERGVLLAELHLLSGLMHLTRRDYLAAAKGLKNACSEVSRIHDAHPEEVEHLKVLGALEVGLSAVPKNLRWLGSLLCLRGDLEAGLAHLKRSSTEGALMAEESEIILAYVEKNLMDKPEDGRDRLRQLSVKHPGCYPYRYLLGLSCLDSRDAASALAIFSGEENAYAHDSRVFRSPFWTFNRANALYYQLEYADAEAGYEDFFTTYRGEAGIGEARFRLAMSKALRGDETGARTVFAQMTKEPKKGYDADAYVYNLALRYQGRSLTQTERALYRARNLFDGGYFPDALAQLTPLLATPGKLSNEDRTELWYRQGRILQEMGRLEAAKQAFGKCLLEKPAFNLWMKVYAHYYLGQVMEKTARPDLARQLYTAALGFSDYYYQNGLEQRCKTALSQMK